MTHSKELIREQNIAEVEALKIKFPGCDKTQEVLMSLIEKYAGKMREVLDRNEHATPQEIADAIKTT